MDPSTQRMLERARARRQKLDLELKSAGQDATRSHIPLQENSQTQRVKVTTEVEVIIASPGNTDAIKKVSVSPAKVSFCGEHKENESNCDSDESQPPVEVSEPAAVRNVMRSQLKRLGALYSDTQLSSPIHRTEGNFNVEEETRASKPKARVARFAALADNIKQWEDDLSHPNNFFNEENGEENKVQSTASIKIPKTSTPHNKSPAKKVIWDEKLLEKLEAQGFSRTSSNKRLTYDYSKHSSQDKEAITSVHGENSERKRDAKSSGIEIKHVPENDNRDQNAKQISKRETTEFNDPHHSRNAATSVKSEVYLKKVDNKNNTSPQKEAVVAKSSGSPSKMDLKSTCPQKITRDSPKTGSVLHKASLFEASSPTKKLCKDPTELSVSERMALFERNKGQALVPKAPFSMSVPAKYLENTDVCSSKNIVNDSIGKLNQCDKILQETRKEEIEKPTSSKDFQRSLINEVPSKVMSQRTIFEKGMGLQPMEKVQNDQVERQKEIDMLRNRWEKNKRLVSSLQQDEKGVVPAPPPLPEGQTSYKSSLQISSLPQITSVIRKPSPSKNYEAVSLHKEKAESKYADFCKVKKIRVSPPKPGNLYPQLSDIEVTTTENESEAPDEVESSSSDEEGSNNGDSSFGRKVLEAAGINSKSPVSQPKSNLDSSYSDLSESAVLQDMDGFLDEALGDESSSETDQEGPTPPKRTRDRSRSPRKVRNKTSPSTKPSQSFRYTPGTSPDRRRSPQKSPVKQNIYVPSSVVDGDHEMPLMHSVSFYRKQQNSASKSTPVRQIIRPPEITLKAQKEPSECVYEETAVEHKIRELLDEVCKQQTVISQASQALNLCTATVEFSESAEQVEGERLLLLATHKRQAALHEIQRLKVEGSLKPLTDSGPTNTSLDKGSLLIAKIILPLKKEYVQRLSEEDMCYHFVCLVRCQEQVLITKVLAAIPQNLNQDHSLTWDVPLRVVDLFSDFKVNLEVYGLQTHKEMLPHNVKYHINSKKDTGKSWLMSKKTLKQDSRLVMPSIHSPAGPSAVRSPEFRLTGYVVFSLKEIHRTHFTLNKVAYSSPLQGNMQLKMSSELSVDVCEKGFLTMFEDISGFGAWHRRWFVLKGCNLAYWKYPDDEKKVPVGQIDLNACTTQVVGLVSREICARPNTFLLETTRPAQPDDKSSLVLVQHEDHTIIRNLLSADTKEERLVWCNQINKALSLLRAWGSKV